MAIGELDQAKLSVLAAAGPYPIEAYGFVHAGLGYTVRRVHGGGPMARGASSGPASSQATGQPASHAAGAGQQLSLDMDDSRPVRRHVNGQQLCLGLRDFAVDRFGLFAPAVFGHWNIHRTDDFGRMVFAMIKAEIMSRTSDDSIDDFRGVYDFDEAFSRDSLLSGIGVRHSEPGVPGAPTAPGAGRPVAGTPGAGTPGAAARRDV